MVLYGMKPSPYLNAAAAGLYIGGIVLLIHTGFSLMGPRETILIPMTMLSLLVLSVATMAYLFFFQPLVLLLEGRTRASALFFAKTVATFAFFTLLFGLAALFLSLV